MMDLEPGALDGVEGLAYKQGEAVARVRLHDERTQRQIEVPLPGSGGHGSKPGPVEGLLAIQFIEFQTAERSTVLTPAAQALHDDLERMARRERVNTVTVDIELDDGRALPGAQVAGFFGGLPGEPTGTIWYGLSAPEAG